jgi:diguanylate cyclase (GGDEF)-like protein
VRILIAEDDPVSSRVLAATLMKWGHEVVVTGNGLEAWQVLRGENPPLLAILDWMMPGMDGLEVCRKVRHETANSPTYLILLTAKSRKEDLIEGFEAGADDFLTKPFDRHELRVRLQVGARVVELQRSLAERVCELEAAIVERQRAEEALRNLTLTDDLTGLHNHRGFFTIAEHHLKIARRSNQSSLLIYADLDGLKQINDTYGHNEGSQAITKAAGILRRTFRDSDLIARLGGDEFVILVADASMSNIESITRRLCENFRINNEQGNHRYKLSLSLGTVCIDVHTNSTIEELIAAADEAMYEHKRGKRKTELQPNVTGTNTDQARRVVGA